MAHAAPSTCSPWFAAMCPALTCWLRGCGRGSGWVAETGWGYRARAFYCSRTASPTAATPEPMKRGCSMNAAVTVAVGVVAEKWDCRGCEGAAGFDCDLSRVAAILATRTIDWNLDWATGRNLVLRRHLPRIECARSTRSPSHTENTPIPSLCRIAFCRLLDHSLERKAPDRRKKTTHRLG